MLYQIHALSQFMNTVMTTALIFHHLFAAFRKGVRLTDLKTYLSYFPQEHISYIYL